MTELHPITPSPELIEEWIELSRPQKDRSPNPNVLATYAARWGSDQELEACCEWLKSEGHEYEHEALFAARRPKPPSLKEQALMALEDGDTGPGASLTPTEISIIRRALEALPDD